MVALFPHIVEVSLVAAAILILRRQFACEDSAILEYLIVVAGWRQVRRIEVGIAIVELDAWQLIFVEVDVHSCGLKWRICDDDEELLDDMAGRGALLTAETLVNHRLELIQHFVVFALCEFLFLPPQASQFGLNFLYSAFKSGGSKSFVWHKSSPFSLKWRSQASVVWSISAARVIGPTPPGTGV